MICSVCRSAIPPDDMYVECTDGSVVCSVCVAEAMKDKYGDEEVIENDEQP